MPLVVVERGLVGHRCSLQPAGQLETVSLCRRSGTPQARRVEDLRAPREHHRQTGAVSDVPGTRYARTEDGAHVAYQVVGGGPPDIVYANSFMGHVEVSWEYPAAANFY